MIFWFTIFINKHLPRKVMFVGVFGMPFCLKPIFVTSGMPVWSCPRNLTCVEPQWPMIVQPGGLRAVQLLGATKEQLVIYPWQSNSPVWYSDLASTCFIRLGLGLWPGKYEKWCTFVLSAVITVVYWIVINYWSWFHCDYCDWMNLQYF